MMNKELAIALSKDENFQRICVSAIRYALGRRTYIVGITCDFMKKYVEQLSDNSIHTIIRDIEECQKINQLGDECDIYDWLELKQFLIDELKKRGSKK